MDSDTDPFRERGCWACGEPVPVETDATGYVSCGRCGLRFHPEGVAPRDVYDGSYFQDYSGGDYIEAERLRRFEAKVRLGLLPAPRPGRNRLLEIGSAAGFFLDEARRAGWSPVGIEPSAEIAAFAQDELGLDVKVGFAEDVDLSQEKLDAICAWHSLEHIPDPYRLLVSLREKLAESGTFAIEVPNGASIRAGMLGTEWVPLEPHVHVAQWTPSSLAALFERAGFTDLQVTTVPFITYIERASARIPRRVLLALRQRRWLREPHPDGHELLRLVARKMPEPGDTHARSPRPAGLPSTAPSQVQGTGRGHP